MQTVEIRAANVHTSLGKLFRGDRAELPNKEINTLTRVRPDCMVVVEVAEAVVEPKPVIKSKSNTEKGFPKMTLKAKGEKVSKK